MQTNVKSCNSKMFGFFSGVISIGILTDLISAKSKIIAYLSGFG